MAELISELKNISVEYNSRDRTVYAVRGVDLKVLKGQITGIVGESGSGKSTLAMTFLNLLEGKGKITSGKVMYYGYRNPVNVLDMKPSQLRNYRWKEVSMIFQGSMNALNPVLKIEEQIEDVMIEHGTPAEEAKKEVDNLLRLAGLNPSVKMSYPHELSGGMRQRVNIAIALACNPKMLIADEATTALDVVVQRQIMSRLLRLKEQLGLSITFITHDISLISNIADNINVMYAGKIVESGPISDVVRNPKHPYTIALLNSIPTLKKDIKIVGIPGAPPDLSKPISGCPFAPRCPKAFEKCMRVEPDLISIGDNRIVSCHLYG